jgi:hypothetical protein
VVLVSHEDEVPLEGSLGEGRSRGSEYLEGHETCNSILCRDGERWVKVDLRGVDEIHPAQIVGEDVCLALFMLQLEAVGLEIETPALKDTLRRLLHVEKVVVVRLQNEIFTL